MEITRVLLEKRVELYQEQRASAQAQVYGYDGAIQDLEHWLEELDKKEPEPEPEKGKVIDLKEQLEGKGFQMGHKE